MKREEMTNMADVEIKARLAIAIAEVELYARLARARGIPVTLDLVEHRSVLVPEGYYGIVWCDE